MKKFKNILFILVVLFLVVVKVDAADNKYEKVWEKDRATEFDEAYQDVIVVKDGTLVIGNVCKVAGAKDCYALIEKYNNDGEVVWTKEYQDTDTVFYAAVEVEDGYVVLLEDYSVSDLRNYNLVKYSFTGEKVWETTIETGINQSQTGYCVLDYANNLISAVFGDANVYLVNNNGELVKELEMEEESFPIAAMDKNGIYVVRNVINTVDLGFDLVLEVYGNDYSLVKTIVLHDSEYNVETNQLTAIAYADAFEIIDGKFIVAKYDLIEDVSSTLILNDKYEVIKEIKYDSSYIVYEFADAKNGFLSLVNYVHNNGTCPGGAKGIQMDEILNVRDTREDYECGKEYMIVYKHSFTGEEIWKLDLDFNTDNAHIAGKNNLMMVVVNDEDVNYNAHLQKYVGEYEVTTKTDGNGDVEVNRVDGSDEVEFTITPKEGYKLVKVIVTTSSGEKVEFTDNKFTMPNEDVVITVEFEKIPENPNTGLSNPLIVFSGILAIALVGSLVVKKKKFI